MNEINVYIFHKSEIVDFRIFDNSRKIVKNKTIIKIVNKNEFICMMFKIETQFDNRLTTKRISTQIRQNNENNKTATANGRRRPGKSGFADVYAFRYSDSFWFLLQCQLHENVEQFSKRLLKFLNWDWLWKKKFHLKKNSLLCNQRFHQF